MKMKFVLSLCLPLLYLPNSWGHARLVANENLSTRSTNAGIKSAPCGGLARVTPKELKAGSSIQVQWQEVINHPGRFEFYFSAANDANFTLLKTVPDTKDATNDLPHSYTTTLTLPNVACDNCTIQMIQVMTENPASPTYYYSCSDIKLVIDTTTTTNPTPTPSPTPKTETCP